MAGCCHCVFFLMAMLLVQQDSRTCEAPKCRTPFRELKKDRCPRAYWATIILRLYSAVFKKSKLTLLCRYVFVSRSILARFYDFDTSRASTQVVQIIRPILHHRYSLIQIPSVVVGTLDTPHLVR